MFSLRIQKCLSMYNILKFKIVPYPMLCARNFVHFTPPPLSFWIIMDPPLITSS